MKSLNDLRREIDEIDDALFALFQRRSAVVKEVAAYKNAHDLPILSAEREREVLDAVAARAGTQEADAMRILFQTVMDVSKTIQYRQLFAGNAAGLVRIADPVVACQGIRGCYAHLAARREFGDRVTVRFYPTFAEVFFAVRDGVCDYGMLPIENSSNGAVADVYELMRTHHFAILATVKLGIRHSLLSRADTLDTVTDLYSHPQALGQCRAFLKAHPQITPHEYSNTAAAAQFAAQAGGGTAAIASSECAALYDLHELRSDLQDDDGNHTCFLVIAKGKA